MTKIQTKKLVATLILSITLVLILASPLLTVNSSASEPTGLMPQDMQRLRYEMPYLDIPLPKTFEATVKLEANVELENTSPVIASYIDITMATFTLSINSVGNPYFIVYEEYGKSTKVLFDEVDVRTGEWVNIGIVIDNEASCVLCYINGELKSTKNAAVPDNIRLDYSITIGGSKFWSSRFSGAIKDVAIFQDARSATEIAQDYAGAPSGDDLVGYYDFTSVTTENTPATIEDLSPAGNDLKKLAYLYDNPVNPPNEYAYSFAIVGDMQIVNRKYPESLPKIYDWIKANVEEKKIAFAFNLGDLTDKDTKAEWERAEKAIHTLDGVIPYSFVRGNHDKTLSYFHEAFKYEDYEDKIAGSYDNTMLNTYQKFEVCGNKYLILNLDFKLTRSIVNWADEVVRQNHDYNVIITTHIYLNPDGTTLDRENDQENATAYKSLFDGEELWEVFISQHKNIVAVLSGHITSNTLLTTYRKGVHGNTVTQMLIDPQGIDGINSGGLGLVGMLYFTEDGKLASTEYYSTIREKYYLKENERTISFDMIQSNGSVPENHSYDTLQHDEEKHWSVCACGDIINTVPHEFGDWIILYEPTEEKQGRRYCECVCGQRKFENYDYTPPLLDDEKDEDTIVTVIIMVGGILLIIGGTTLASFVFIRKKTNTPIQKVAEEEYQDQYPGEEFFENFEYNPDEESKDGEDEGN